MFNNFLYDPATAAILGGVVQSSSDRYIKQGRREGALMVERSLADVLKSKKEISHETPVISASDYNKGEYKILSGYKVIAKYGSSEMKLGEFKISPGERYPPAPQMLRDISANGGEFVRDKIKLRAIYTPPI